MIFMYLVIVLACLVTIGQGVGRPASTHPLRTPRITPRPPTISNPPRGGTQQRDVSAIFRTGGQHMFPRFGSSGGTHHRTGAEVNTFGLSDNCYYTTLAGLRGMTVDMLIRQTEIMQYRTANMDEIKRLYRAAHLPIYQIHAFNSVAELTSFFQQTENLHERPVSIPFGYQIASDMNHMVALHIRRLSDGTIDGRLEDFQLAHDAPKRIQDTLPRSAKYYVFDTYGFDARMGS
jgi:hypothetical protein